METGKATARVDVSEKEYATVRTADDRETRKGDRKGPHPSASSTPASTMTTTWLTRRFFVEAGILRRL